MRIKRICNILFRGNRFNKLILHLLDELDGVVGNKAEGSHDGAVFDRPGGADESDEVGHVRNSYAEVGFGADFPLVG